MARGPGTRRLGPIFVKKPTLAAKNRSKDPQKRTSIVFMRAAFSENHTYGRLRVPVFISALSFARARARDTPLRADFCQEPTPAAQNRSKYPQK
jgi:hypothetical protein